MPHISLMQPEEAAGARRLIYTVAHQMFHYGETLEQTIVLYEDEWPLRDVLDFQHSYIENGGTFLVMREGERIIATGALRWLEDGVCEIKRLWLLPEFHGQGLGYQMMQELLTVARRLGYQKVRLETSPEYQPRAYAFYHRMGFVDIPRYGDDPDDIGMEMAL